MNTTELIVEIRLEKNSGPYRVWTHNLCNTGRLISSTGSVVFITARITPIFISSTAAKLVPNILLCFPLDLISKAERGTLMSLATQDFHKLFPGLHS